MTEKYKISIDDLRVALNTPIGGNTSGFVSVDDIRIRNVKDCKRFFGIPASQGLSKEKREELNRSKESSVLDDLETDAIKELRGTGMKSSTDFDLNDIFDKY